MANPAKSCLIAVQVHYLNLPTTEIPFTPDQHQPGEAMQDIYVGYKIAIDFVLFSLSYRLFNL